MSDLVDSTGTCWDSRSKKHTHIDSDGVRECEDPECYDRLFGPPRDNEFIILGYQHSRWPWVTWWRSFKARRATRKSMNASSE